MSIFLAIFVLIFGLVIGSFLNAVIWRLRTREGFVRGRSYCPRCGHQLAAWDLVPLCSFIWLKGRCRYCRQAISWQYPVVEAAVGVLFLLFAWRVAPPGNLWHGPDIMSLLLAWFLVAVMTIVFVYDLRYMLILRSVTLPAAALAFLANLALGRSLTDLLIGCLLGYGFFWLQHVVSRGRWIGGGDMQLGLLMGAALGWPLIAVALWLAYVVGALYAGVMLLLRRSGWKSQIPFGTFLSAATLATLLIGTKLLSWYLHIPL